MIHAQTTKLLGFNFRRGLFEEELSNFSRSVVY